MNFKEARRAVGADGSTYIHSMAYVQACRFLNADSALKAVYKRLKKAPELVSIAILRDAIQEKELAGELMRTALLGHFGYLPMLLDFQGTILDLRNGTEVLPVESYSSLYRIEPPAAPDLHADAAIVMEDAQ